MSKMSDDFKNKSMLRTAVTSNAMGMADGGVAGLAGLRQRTIDGAVEGAMRPATPAPAPAPTPAAAPAPGGMISDGVVTRPAPAPVAPTPQPGIFARLRKAIGMADGGVPSSPWDSAYAPGGSLSNRAKPQSVQSILAATLAQRNQPTAPIAPSPAATPSPELAPASPAATPMAAAPATSTQPAMGSGPTPTAGPGREMSNSEWNQMAAGTLPSTPTVSSASNWNSQQNDASRMQNSMSILQAKPISSSLVLPNKQPGASWTPDVQNPGKTDGAAIRVGQTQYGGGLRGGGRVTGPGGPREDKVGPVMLSNGEYVLPAKTVQKLGGPEEIDEVVRATNDGREPQHADPDDHGKRHGLRGLSVGGGDFPDIDPRMLPDRAASMPMVEVPPAGPTGPTPGVPQPARGPTNWDNVNRVYGNRPATTVSPEMQAFQQAQAADQAGVRAGQAVQAAKQAAAQAAAVEAAAPKAASPGLFKAASSFVGSATRGTGSALRFAAKAANNPYTIAAGSAVASDDVGAGSDVLRAPDGSVSNAYQGYQLTPTAAAMSDRERYALMQRVNSGDMMAKQTLLGASPVSATVDPTAKYGGSQGSMSPTIPGQPATGLHGQDPNAAAVIAQNEQNRQAMDRNTPDTGGAIQQVGNTFYGGVGGAQGKALEDAEAAKGRQRYQNDAAGMYAAIQGHIANGDLETANKLAWDPASRALVNQGYAARNAAMAANSRSSTPDEDALNSRYDKAADRLRGLFRSDKAQGNLAKHLTELNQQRAGELANLRNTNVTARGQNLLSEGNQMRIASEQAIANQRNQFDWRKTMMEQTNKDREFGLNSAKHGTEVAKILHDQQVERETKNQSVFDTFAAKRFIGPDGKPDQAAAAEFSQFAHSSLGDVYSKPAPERDRILASAANRWEIQRNSNKAAPDGYTATTSQQLRDIKGYHKGGVEDIPQIGITGWAVGKLPFVNNDVVDFADGNSRTARSLGARDSQDIKDIVYQNQNNGLRNK